MLDPSLPLTVGELEEWGNPADPEAFEYMSSYCPYTNLRRREYPALFVRASLHDSQVMYWEPAKYVARLRAVKTDANPVLLLTNLGAGHDGASGRYDQLEEAAVDTAFVLWQMGVTE
jgi:oligopeptidase B